MTCGKLSVQTCMNRRTLGDFNSPLTCILTLSQHILKIIVLVYADGKCRHVLWGIFSVHVFMKWSNHKDTAVVMGAAHAFLGFINSTFVIPHTIRVFAALRVPSATPRANFRPFQQSDIPSTSNVERLSFSKNTLLKKFCRCTEFKLLWYKQHSRLAVHHCSHILLVG